MLNGTAERIVTQSQLRRCVQHPCSSTGVGFLGLEMRSEKEKFLRNVHKKVSAAVKSGKLVRQPCVECGELKVDGHHDDYDKPLEVVWLCRPHHMRLHGQAILSDKIILEIANCGLSYSQTVKKYGVSDNTVWRIRTGRIWSDVTGIKRR